MSLKIDYVYLILLIIMKVILNLWNLEEKLSGNLWCVIQQMTVFMGLNPCNDLSGVSSTRTIKLPIAVILLQNKYVVSCFGKMLIRIENHDIIKKKWDIFNRNNVTHFSFM